jgi:DNA-binding MarR family transcriptional regulator
MASEIRKGPGAVVSRRLGYLLKHAAMRIEVIADGALAPLGIDSREFGILLLISANEPGSQQEAAERLSIDRTSMVARLDDLERKGLVARRADAQDRRRNVIELTDAGEDTLRRAVEAADAAEDELLRSLTPADAAKLREALHTVVMGGEDG